MQLLRSFQDVAERCDVLSVHLALTPDTGGLVRVAERAVGRNPNWVEFVDLAAR